MSLQTPRTLASALLVALTVATAGRAQSTASTNSSGASTSTAPAKTALKQLPRRPLVLEEHPLHRALLRREVVRVPAGA